VTILQSAKSTCGFLLCSVTNLEILNFVFKGFGKMKELTYGQLYRS